MVSNRFRRMYPHEADKCQGDEVDGRMGIRHRGKTIWSLLTRTRDYFPFPAFTAAHRRFCASEIALRALVDNRLFLRTGRSAATAARRPRRTNREGTAPPPSALIVFRIDWSWRDSSSSAA